MAAVIGSTDWTAARLEQLRKLWASPLSAKAIGEAMGITKNAVVGRAHRLGLAARASPIKRAEPGAPPVVPKKALQRAAKVTLPTLQPDAASAAPASAAPVSSPKRRGTCAFPMWPDGASGAPHFPVCDAPTDGGSYCAAHRERCRSHATLAPVRPPKYDRTVRVAT